MSTTFNNLQPEVDKIKSADHTSPMSGRDSRYVIVIEKTATGFSAYVPDLPGCIATAGDQAELKGEMKSAIRFHIDGLKEDGLPVPQATSIAEYVEV